MKILDYELRYIGDPQHSWLEVPIKILETLGIAEKISGYSYMKGKNAYLETDSDYATFIDALGYKPIFSMEFVNGYSRVRTYQHYNYQEYKLITDKKKLIKNELRKLRHQTLTELGLKRVRGALGGIYYE